MRRGRWLHHGSSISHCLEAHDPLGPWPQQAARALRIPVTNLGFAGNAVLDPFVAQTIARQQVAVITLKLGINIVNLDAMKRRTFMPAVHGFLDLVREGHPDTPIVVISAIACPAFEDVPGPTREVEPGHYGGTPRGVVDSDGSLTLSDTREILADVIAARSDDANLHYLDGRCLFGPEDSALLYDGLHPDQQGYDLISQRFVMLAKDPVTSLGRAFAPLL
jgi:lysophospholipase L1-like esterase